MKSLKLLFLLGVLSSGTSVFIQSPLQAACFSAPYDMAKKHAYEGERLLERLEAAILEVPDVGTKIATSSERIRMVGEKTDLYKMLNSMAKAENEGHSFEMGLWIRLEESLFFDAQLENKVFAKRVEEMYKLYRMQMGSLHLPEIMKAMKRPKTSGKAKSQLIQSLEKFNIFFSHVYEREIDLFNPQDFMSYFGIEARKDFGPRLTELRNRNRALNNRIQQFLSVEGASADEGTQIAVRLRKEFFKQEDGLVDFNMKGFYQRSFSFLDIKEMIIALGLPEAKEAEYLGMLKAVAKSPDLKEHVQKNSGLLVLYKAFLEVFNEVPSLTNTVAGQRRLSLEQYLYVKTAIFRRKRVREIAEIKIDHLLKRAEQLEELIEQLRNKARHIQTRYQHTSAEVEEALDGIPASVLDYPEEQFDHLAQSLTQMDIALDHILDREIQRVGKESIQEFEGLNHNWNLVIEGKRYHVAGSDYQYVVFHRDVLKHFDNQESFGDRFLTALGKGYVPIKNASGLRSISSIHKDFRDIKLITKGKTRIIGKLIGDTIHFFGIHHTDEAYKPAVVSRMIDEYQPH